MRRTSRMSAAVVAIAALGLLGCASGAPTGAGTASGDPAPDPTPGDSAPADPGQGAAACAEPTATLDPERVRAGESLSVEGEGWAPCIDTIGVDAESGETTDAGDPTPAPVTIAWVQAGSRVELGTVDPVDGAFTLAVTAPAEAAPGEATIEVVSGDFPPGVALSVQVEE